MKAIIKFTKYFRSVFAGQLRLFSAFKDHAKENIEEVNKAGPVGEYERRIALGELVRGDTFQVDTLKRMQRLYDELIENANTCNLDTHSISRGKWLLSHFTNSNYSPVKGFYLYGGIGTGKTMMMDLFYNQLPHSWRKQRIHFHEFMLGVHSRLHKHKGVADPLELVAEEILEESILLCFDEFMVPDISLAFIMHRFFQHLFRKGAILVATSNRAPKDLYQGRLQSDFSLPFMELMQERCVIHEISSSVDYRQMSLDLQDFYFVGNNVGTNLILKEEFKKLVGEHRVARGEVEVGMGRVLKVPSGANGCAYFTFDELCNKPRAAADYCALFQNFHTLALEGVPVFGVHNKPAAYRFVTLIDVMYDNKTRLFYTAEGSPIQLFQRVVTISMAKNMIEGTFINEGFDLCVDDKLGFSKHRAISRLTEMRGKEYLKQHEMRFPKDIKM